MLVRAGPESVKVKILFESETGMSRWMEEMRLMRKVRWEAILTQSPKAKRFVAARRTYKPLHGELRSQIKSRSWTYHC